MFKWNRSLLLLVSLSISVNGSAAASEKLEEEVRSSRRFGLSGNILGDPYLSVLGGTVAYNITGFARAHVSVSIPGIGAGARLFVPGWNLSPTVGLSYSWTYFIDGVWHGLTVPVGLDWQFDRGFYVAAGANIPIKTIRIDKVNVMKAILVVPYLSIGYFFQ